MKRLKIRVMGKVQGVFYRVSTQEEALGLGLTGYVKNDYDGSVLIEAEGPSDQLELLLSWCRQGPPYSDVAGVEFEEVPVKGDKSFKITR